MGISSMEWRGDFQIASMELRSGFQIGSLEWWGGFHIGSVEWWDGCQSLEQCGAWNAAVTVVSPACPRSLRIMEGPA